MEPHRMLAAIAATVADRITLYSRSKSGAVTDPGLNALLFQHPELEHPELLLTQMPKEAAFSSITDPDSLWER
jgi:hypothetical protein